MGQRNLLPDRGATSGLPRVNPSRRQQGAQPRPTLPLGGSIQDALDPSRESFTGFLCGAEVPLFLVGGNSDVDVVVGRVFDGGPSPRALNLCHDSFIMSSHKSLDKGPDRVFNVITLTDPTKEPQMFKVTFRSFSKVLNKEFFNVELHRSMDDAKLRACALGWQVWKVESA